MWVLIDWFILIWVCHLFAYYLIVALYTRLVAITAMMNLYFQSKVEVSVRGNKDKISLC